MQRAYRPTLAVFLLASACLPGSNAPAQKGTAPSGDSAQLSSADARSDAALVSAAVPPDLNPRVAIDAGSALIPLGPVGWRSVPTMQNGFYTVLDGLCSKLAAGRVGKEVVVYYGGEGNSFNDHSQRSGAASFIALRDAGLDSIGDPSISSPTGLAGTSLDNFWVADSTGTRTSNGAILHRYNRGNWERTYGVDQTNLHAWLDGGVIGSLGMAAAFGEIWVEDSVTKPPATLTDGFHFPALSAFPTGDVLVIGYDEGANSQGAMVARHWAPGQTVTQQRLDRLLPQPVGERGWPELHEIAPDEVYASLGRSVARWDGKSFRAFAKISQGTTMQRVERAAPDDLWVLTDAPSLEHLTPGVAVVVKTPEPLVSLGGFDVGDRWAVGKSGKLYRFDANQFQSVPLPVPTFTAGSTLKATRVLVVSTGDVLVTAMYWEKGASWKEQELHTALFRSRPVQETLRCNEPDPENNNIHLGQGFQSWPPMATAACKTPFAVLARRSNALKSNDDWPRIRGALKGHAELGKVELVEFSSGNRTFVGASATDLDVAKKLVQIVAKNDRLRPEIVCGEPIVTRRLGVDLSSGTATVQ
jgi:hypothetical protein